MNTLVYLISWNIWYILLYIFQCAILLTIKLVWWSWGESNSWPPACKAGALANWATAPYLYCNVLVKYYFQINNKSDFRPRERLSPLSIFRNLLFLLRKEVIQPHLLIRLPCYDFTPIIGSTFDCCLYKLAHRLRVFPTLMVWRAVCTRPGNVFTAVCWPAITSNSDFMKANFSLQSELGLFFEFCFTSLCRLSLLQPL